MTNRFRLLSLAALGTTAALTLTACGSSSGSTSATSPGSVSPTSAAMASMTMTTPSGSAGAASGSPAGSAAPSMTSMSAMPSVTASASDSSAHNAADVTFATDMITHHRQAVTMADMAAKSASSPAVKTLAAQIKAAQSPEITEMSGWLTSWGQKVPAAGMDMGMPGMDMPGVMTSAEMSKLQAATGVAFDKLWLQMMISHHEGAVTMAKTELSKGAAAQAKTLAQSIITSQQAQITTMRKLFTGM